MKRRDLLTLVIRDLPKDLIRLGMQRAQEAVGGRLAGGWRAPSHIPPPRGRGIPVGRLTAPRKRLLTVPVTHHRHTIVQGATRMGKTEWAIQYVVNRAKAGLGSAYLDNTDGVAARRILEALPEECMARVVFLDHSDRYRPLPIGLHAAANDPFAMDDVVAWWVTFFSHSFGIGDQFMTQELASYAFRLAATQPPVTLLEVAQIVADPWSRARAMHRIDRRVDGDVLAWWQRFEQQSAEKQRFVTDSFMRRINLVLSRRALKHMLCQPPVEPYPYRQWMDEGWTVLIVCRESMGSLAVRTAMSLHLLNFWSAALGRDDVPQEQRPPFVVVADEPQTWLPGNAHLLDDLFSKGGKYGLWIVALFQSTAQVQKQEGGARLLDVMLANQPDLIMFRCTSSIPMPEFDMASLPRFHFVARLGDWPPVQCTGLGRATQLADRSSFVEEQAKRWGRPWDVVASDIERRMGAWSAGADSGEGKSGLPMSGTRLEWPHDSPRGTDKSSGSSLRTNW